MEKSNDLLDIISALWKRRKSILATTIAAAVIAIVVSLLLDNYYQSSTQFYAASQDLAKPLPIGKEDLNSDFYGNDEDLDRLFSLAKSGLVKDYLIDSFDLYQHYEIDTSDTKAKYKILLKINKLYKTLKTEYDAIELLVEDKDPLIAMKMANAARNKIADLSQQMIRNSQNNKVISLKENIKSKENHLSTLNDSLNRLKTEYGIIDIYGQGEILASQKQILSLKYSTAQSKYTSLKNNAAYRDSIEYFSSIAGALRTQLDNLDSTLKKFNQGFNHIAQLDNLRSEYSKQISVDQQRLNQMQASLNATIQTLHIVEEATLPVVKSRPKRSLYVIGATLFTFLFSCIGVLLLHTYRDVDWSKVLAD